MRMAFCMSPSCLYILSIMFVTSYATTSGLRPKGSRGFTLTRPILKSTRYLLPTSTSPYSLCKSKTRVGTPSSSNWWIIVLVTCVLPAPLVPTINTWGLTAVSPTGFHTKASPSRHPMRTSKHPSPNNRIVPYY